MQLISNSLESSHLEHLKRLLYDKYESITWVSPFLAADISSLLGELDFSRVKIVTFITTLKTNDFEQLSKPYQLRDIYEFFKINYPKIKIAIHINNSLHGKLYFFSSEKESKLLLSSANFTRNGLSNNSEWGVLVDNIDVVEQAKEEVFADIDIEQLTELQVRKACQHADHYISNNPELIPNSINYDLDILHYVANSEDPSNTDPKYFIKPIGHTGEKLLKEDKREFSDKYQQQHFSTKKRPKSVRKGDYLITTAIGAGSILSFYRVTGVPEWVSDEEVEQDPKLKRWRWYIESENLSREFGAIWWEHDITRNSAVEEFKSSNPQVPITNAGGYTLNSLNRGSDKIQLSKEFGRFLIGKIEILCKG